MGAGTGSGSGVGAAESPKSVLFVQNKKGSLCSEPRFSGLDGTRTRDLRRDRAAF
jgi:hypothetical protein